MSSAVAKENTSISLGAGDPAPWFRQRSFSNPSYAFDTAAGRYIVMLFYGSAADPPARAALDAAMAGRRWFDDDNACFFGVSLDPADESEGRVRDALPGMRFFWDFDGAVSRLYGALPREAGAGPAPPSRRFWLVLDPTLRVLASFALGDHAALFAFLNRLPPAATFAGFEVFAPVLVLPNVFEPEFCRRLIGLYDEHGGQESGFMRDVGGKTVEIKDANHKVRRDYNLEDQALVRQVQARVQRRVVPEIAKVHQFKVTRMERYLVSCYAAEDGGHFRAHRDNTTKGTAHRRFALSINLNGEFEGGEVGFPEYGPRRYKAPPGGAVVFSCSLLHAVSRVTAGRRYAFLPFLYDDAAAKIREANNQFLESERQYKS